ncbi:acid-sensing ion channel 5-like [Galendromus occidentalis]|uniref:Acid-sensing ion channel 5-like n=1 Tax=Galendromus occidentalis TaxID=34638 RepID=A0AAJ7L947_9ACAR|nr:acid-sensing ion channel 5-like [Galendromus occidentalis]
MAALYEEDSPLGTTYKTVVYSAMCALTIYMFWYASADYWKFAVSTITEIKDRSVEGLRMPSITVCNMDGFKRSIFCADIYRNLTRELCDLEDEVEFAGRFMNLYGDQMLQEIADNSVFSRQDQLVSCFFAGKPCEEHWFREKIVSFPRYGECFCLFCDEEDAGKYGRVRGRATIDGGLSLVLRSHRSESMKSVKTPGYLVMIHYPGTMPEVNSNAVYLNGGTTTTIGLSVHVSRRLREPYVTRCQQEYHEDIVDTFGAYVTQICFKVEYALDFFKQCGFTPEVKARSDYLDTDALCEMHPEAKECCRNLDDRNVRNGICPLVCTETTYSKQVSTSAWRLPSAKNASIFFSRLKLYFTSLSCEYTTEVPSMTFVQLINLVGGYMGMFVGFSFLIFFEIVEIIIRTCRLHLHG